MRTLLVEDHPPLAEAIVGGLRRAGFAVDVAGTVKQAHEAFAFNEYDLAILDLGLPDGSGLELLENWRAKGSVPIIIMTARGALGDRIAGLDSGADDYVVKPVEVPELIARCRAVLRRPGNRESVVLTAGKLRLDTSSRSVECAGELLDLGRRETSVLEALLRRPNRVVPRHALAELLYDNEADVSANAVDAAVSRLRRALAEQAAGVSLKTVRGVGWMLSDRTP